MPAKWHFLEYDHSLPSSLQRDLDFVGGFLLSLAASLNLAVEPAVGEKAEADESDILTAPEYLLDESAPSPSNDMYSLGLLLHALHLPPSPPFSHHNSLSSARQTLESSLGRPLPQWRKLPTETQEVLSGLVNRFPSRRLSAREFEASTYFQSVLVGTLNFLSRESFNAQTVEAQTGFLKGLMQVSALFLGHALAGVELSFFLAFLCHLRPSPSSFQFYTPHTIPSLTRRSSLASPQKSTAAKSSPRCSKRRGNRAWYRFYCPMCSISLEGWMR